MKLPGSSKSQLGWEAPISVRFDYFTRPNTRRAYARPFVGSIEDNANSLQIGIPPSFRDVMGMADIVSKQRALPTNITTRCHSKPPIKLKNKMVAEALPGVKLLKCQTARQGLVVHVDTGN